MGERLLERPFLDHKVATNDQKKTGNTHTALPLRAPHIVGIIPKESTSIDRHFLPGRFRSFLELCLLLGNLSEFDSSIKILLSSSFPSIFPVITTGRGLHAALATLPPPNAASSSWVRCKNNPPSFLLGDGPQMRRDRWYAKSSKQSTMTLLTTTCCSDDMMMCCRSNTRPRFCRNSRNGFLVSTTTRGMWALGNEKRREKPRAVAVSVSFVSQSEAACG